MSALDDLAQLLGDVHKWWQRTSGWPTQTQHCHLSQVLALREGVHKVCCPIAAESHVLGPCMHSILGPLPGPLCQLRHVAARLDRLVYHMHHVS